MGARQEEESNANHSPRRSGWACRYAPDGRSRGCRITQPLLAWRPDSTPKLFSGPKMIATHPAFNRLIVRYAPINRMGSIRSATTA